MQFRSPALSSPLAHWAMAPLCLLVLAVVPGCRSDVSAAGDAGVDARTQDATGPDGGSHDASLGDGGAPTQWIGPQGGTVDRLRFAAFGDVRPPDLDQDGAYPTQTVHQLFTQMAARSPQIVLGVGDWMFASTESHARTQLTSLLEAEAPYAHTVIHAMGNHECEGWTDSNCPSFNESGQVRAYMDLLLPFTDKAYWSLPVQTDLGTAKVVVVALNAWSEAQSTWLSGALDAPSDYTFVLAHEPPPTHNAPGEDAFQQILAAHGDITLILYGHWHEYQHLSTNEVVTGNGGAPLSDGGYFGYLWVEQRSDGNVEVTEHHIDTDQVMDGFTLTPAGALVP